MIKKVKKSMEINKDVDMNLIIPVNCLKLQAVIRKHSKPKLPYRSQGVRVKSEPCESAKVVPIISYTDLTTKSHKHLQMQSD